MSRTQQLVREWDGRTTTGTVTGGLIDTALSPLLQQNEDRSGWEGTFFWVSIASPVAREKWTYRMTEVGISYPAQPYMPRTELGRKLLALRRRAIERGMKLHDADTILASVRKNRGERTYEEEDVP